MKRNLDKMEVLVVGFSSVLESGWTLMLDQLVLPPEASVHSLGVLLHLLLQLGGQVVVIVRSTHYQL